VRAIAGGLVVLAGAVLWGAGAIAVTLAPGMKTWTSYGNYATAAGVFLVLVGLGVLVADLLPRRPQDSRAGVGGPAGGEPISSTAIRNP
jgi:hypothetical protein